MTTGRRQRLGRTLAVLSAFGALWLTCGAAAGADPPRDPSNRDAVLFLYTQGKALIEAGKVREGCVKLEDARRLDPTAINLLLHLGDCYERLGRTATAHAQFLDAAAVAAKARDAREATATERARALEPRLSRLTVALPAESDLPGLVILRDGVSVPREELGKAGLVDPGPHELEARAPGKVTWREHRDVAGGAPIVVTVPRLADVPPSVPEAPRADEGSAGTRRVIGVAAALLGAVGLGVGAGFGVKAIADNDASKAHCDAQSFCDPRGFDLRLGAERAGTVSTVAFAAGAVALAGGAALFLTARPTPGRVAIVASAAPAGGAIGVRGAF